jgi:predicted translin family RNA/ssDNA-binding protein
MRRSKDMDKFMNKLQEIKSKIFKDKDGWNNYMNVSIEEMDWIFEQIETLQKLQKGYRDIYLSANQMKREYGEALREIDKWIKSTSKPVPYILETLKKTLHEYK